jgi:archaeal flagellin FlaB
MLSSIARKARGDQKGITGLETAIILISFVVVASIFSYVVLSAGLFSSQKSQDAIYKGLKEAEGAIQLRGGVVAIAENTGDHGYLSQLTFTLANAMGGEPIDFSAPLDTGTDGKAPGNSENKVVISYLDSYQKVDDLYWKLTKLGSSDGDNLLDEGEQFQITIGNPVAGQDGGNLVDALSSHPLGPNSRFTIEIKTPIGATLHFERNTPGFIDAVINLY